jgi:hypothetical protein
MKAQFLLLILVFGIGFAAGLYFQLLLPGNSSTIGIPNIILAIFGGAGLMVTLGRVISNWYNQPTLEIMGIIHVEEYFPPNRNRYHRYYSEHYFLRIRNIKRKGTGEDCKGNIMVPNASIDNVSTYWRNTNESRTVGISTMEELKLFTRVKSTGEGYDKIFLPTVILRETDTYPSGENERSYDELFQNELEVHFGSKTGRFIQNPYRKKIEDIIKESKRV